MSQPTIESLQRQLSELSSINDILRNDNFAHLTKGQSLTDLLHRAYILLDGSTLADDETVREQLLTEIAAEIGLRR